VHSWRDLPMKYNQWCSVLRWEKTTRPFLRGREFLWQEGHTIHATAEEAREETLQMLEVYADCCEKELAMPVIRGNKTDKEKFAGAENTYTIECMMHDHKALQSGTSHYFGDGFTRAFDISFSDRNNQKTYPHQTSWGMSTRIIGGIIMTHGDNNGLVLPPHIAPIQVIVLPIAAHKAGVTEKAEELVERLKKAGVRVKGDFSDNSPGWKFANWEMKGVPLRIEIGPKDMENNQCVAVRRDNREKVFLSLDELENAIPALLEEVQKGLYEKAKANLDSHIFPAYSLEEAARLQEENGGFIKTMWCGDLECEMKMKEVAGMSSRCIPFEQEHLSDVCPVCGKAAKHMIYWGVAY
ncbi:MAG: His/Gly/Thr/Pro-type tRNA ligase C-terminal domain-containing protein, partial [Oscillospiraceae bacterium]|nr:His/Gly/Thr/Pro-type tRNA ligase C-terminal domain-containing protein [Oscillospiraceae bacterium]